MDKETQKKLTKNFPKEVVKKAPKGKYGDYVPHHLYTQRLVDVIPGGYDYTYEVVRGADNSIIGAKCKLYIKSTDQTIEEVGDVDVNAVNRNITESELLKLAVSDGIKRCCMRLGIGLELWTGGVSEEHHYAENVEVKPTTNRETKKAEVVNTPSSAPSPKVDAPVETITIVTKGTIEPKCLSCNSELWDNRLDKANGKIKATYPEWKCKNQECDNGNPRIYYIDSFANDKKAPEEWFMPEMPKAKDLDDIEEGVAPF